MLRRMLPRLTALRPYFRLARGYVSVRVWEPMWRTGVRSSVITAAVGALVLATVPASADTMRWALTQAYINNPTLNSQRASVRATDEGVPQALSGYRPRVSLTASATEQLSDQTLKAPSTAGLPGRAR